MKKLLLLLLLSITISCTNDADFNKGKRQLELQGYTNVQNTGYEYWCCGENDTYSTGFRATAKDGTIVTGCICSGWGKGITIRFN